MADSKEKFLPIICNPVAGAGKALLKWRKFSLRLQENSISYKVYFTEHQNHASRIAGKLTQSGTERIGVFGGDGTLNEVIQGIKNISRASAPEVLLTFFPGGSSCDFERFFPSKKNFMERILHPDIVTFDLGCVECTGFTGNRIKRFFINNSSVGVISESIRRFNEPSWIVHCLKKVGIDLAAVAAGLSAVSSWNSPGCHITLDGTEIATASLSNLTLFKNPYFGGGMHYESGGRFDDGWLNAFIIDGRSRWELALTIPSLYTGSTLKKKGTILQRCKRLELMTDLKVPVETDGELVGFPPAKYSIIPKALKFYL